MHAYALEYAVETIQCDKDVVLAAVSQDGYTLQYAAQEPHCYMCHI